MKSLSSELRFQFFQTRLCQAAVTNLVILVQSLSSIDAKGVQQLEISQAYTPIIQRSIYRPQPCLRIISGAQQAAVPASVLLLSSGISLANPKSDSFIYPFSNMSKFSGFRSLYIMFWACRYSIPNMRHPRINLTAISPACLKASHLRDPSAISEYVSPPCAHSITKQKYFQSRKAQCNIVIKLLLDYSNILRYNCMFATSFFRKISYLQTRLIAYFQIIPLSLLSFSSARKTSPKPPPPMRCVTSKLCHLMQCLPGGRGQMSSNVFIISCSCKISSLDFFLAKILGFVHSLVVSVSPEDPFFPRLTFFFGSCFPWVGLFQSSWQQVLVRAPMNSIN